MLKRTVVMGLMALGVFSMPVRADVAPDLVKPLDAKVGAAMAAYNAGDSQKFYADYAKALAATETKQAFDALYTNNYKKQFGNFKARKLNEAKSSLPAAAPVGLLEYTVTMDKGTAIMDVNFMKEGSDYKIQQIQFRK